MVEGVITPRPFFLPSKNYNKGDLVDKLILTLLLMCIFAPMLN
jgi:hypothetical protein